MGSKLTPKAVENVPEFPWQLEYLWRWWNELAMGRAAGGFGPAHLTWLDIDAWCRLTGIEPEPWEVSCLMDIDTLWVAAQSKKQTPTK